MSTTRIPIDGLWRCLCPSIDIVTASLSSRTPRRSLRPRIATDTFRTARPFHISAPRQHETLSNVNTPIISIKAKNTFHDPLPHLPKADVHTLTNQHLHDKLRRLVTEADSYHAICDLVDYLITVRGEAPSLLHYDALIRANSDAENGSANAVRLLLSEMRENGIGGDSRLYHGVLQVLTIHPDYLLRAEIMHEMRERWFGLSPEGWHNAVVGLLRDRQYEAAMDELEQMHSDGIIVQPWLYDIFMFQLVEIEEYDEAFRMLVQRWEKPRSAIQQSVWYLMLDAFGKVLHYDGLKFIWDKRVEQSHMTPSDGMCSTALNVAARFADPELGTSAVRVLASRAALAPYHYEALIEAYTKVGDLKTAFRILSIMAKANLEPNESNTRFLFLHCMKGANIRKEAWEVLTALYNEGHAVPLAGVHVVLEACMRDGDIHQGIEYYKHLHEIIKTGPNTATFNILLRDLSKSKGKKELAMFLAAEMAALGIPPNEITYDRLILVCLMQKEESYEDAFNYLDEMVNEGEGKNEGEGWWMRKGTAEQMVRVCVAAGDKRGWEILAEMERRGMDTARLRVAVESTLKRENLKAKRLEPTTKAGLSAWAFS